MAAEGNNEFKLFGPRDDGEYHSGSALTLSCHLSPEISAVAMEIRWFKGTDCVCLYKNRQVTEGRGYEGRVSLFTQELQRGNVSLQIRDCRGSDGGDYLCQVTNGDSTEECTVGVRDSKCSRSSLYMNSSSSSSSSASRLRVKDGETEMRNTDVQNGVVFR